MRSDLLSHLLSLKWNFFVCFITMTFFKQLTNSSRVSLSVLNMRWWEVLSLDSRAVLFTAGVQRSSRLRRACLRIRSGQVLISLLAALSGLRAPGRTDKTHAHVRGCVKRRGIKMWAISLSASGALGAAGWCEQPFMRAARTLPRPVPWLWFMRHMTFDLWAHMRKCLNCLI